jgi:ribosomal protein S18 acetylase RimI-like enzyme
MELKIGKIDHTDSLPMDLLLLADPSEEMIAKYLYSGEKYAAKSNGELIGVFILDSISPSEIELKTIAVYPEHQRKGVGKELLKYAIRISKMERYESMIVRTADCSDYQIAFYKKLKFEHESTVKGHFIKYYKEPIIENGKEAVDQLFFRRKL